MAVSILLALPFIAAFALYIAGAAAVKKWPAYRMGLFAAGTFSALISVIGPLANAAHMDFRAHMAAHLLFAMLAPLLIVLSAPATLAFKALSVSNGRKLSRLLKSRPLRFLSHPVTAAILNFGGLWILYRTHLYTLMHTNELLQLLIHFHLFAAGYLFTASILYIDPVPHRKSYYFRTIVMILGFAAHGILSKSLYILPPASVPLEQAQIGSMLMYYGGDAIDLALIILFCRQWYKAARPGKNIRTQEQSYSG
ncbi:cytochrome c oxidase assembly protein [Metabacillus sp. GX 13764]|uniref:cytochrome c oxidase assembly protein n=1 Tax=Metabacillus kandeliae TaxID=2900151 RepID=UPI001E49582F|nr:cytochrome c oxidase assembly protein [Metabacillus kandeliae]MCD7034413.1 cytochrome c oxidase assembly protein [Metabacillus kandeliae]